MAGTVVIAANRAGGPGCLAAPQATRTVTVQQQAALVSNSIGTVSSFYDNATAQSTSVSGGSIGAAVDGSAKSGPSTLTATVSRSSPTLAPSRSVARVAAQDGNCGQQPQLSRSSSPAAPASTLRPPPRPPPPAPHGAAFHGSLYGGRQPVSGAAVYETSPAVGPYQQQLTSAPTDWTMGISRKHRPQQSKIRHVDALGQV